jgi:hypothetical protein
MSRYAKAIFSFLAVLVISFSHAQKPVVYFFSEVGLTLYLPPEFKVLDAVQNETLNKKGVSAMSEANNMTIDASPLKTLIAARKSQFDYFNVTVTPYNENKEGPYEDASKQMNKILYTTFHEKLKNAQIDTITRIKTIDGLIFTEFSVKVPVNDKLTLNMFVLSKFYKGYDFGITYLYTDDVTRSQMQSILQSCKFTK